MTTSPAGIDEQVFELLAALPSLGVVGDADLVALLAGLEVVANATQAMQAQVMCDMARRADEQDRAEAQRRGRDLMPHESRGEYVADEIAVTLATTRVDASRRYDLALAVAEHPEVRTAWRLGTLSPRKVAVICDGLVDVSSPAVEALSDEASQYAATHTAPEVRRWLARRVIAADPGMAEIRRSRAVADRKVTVTPLPDGVSELCALLPSVQARQVYDTVNAVAQGAPANDRRTMDQRRADALMDLLTGRAEPPQVNVQVVVPADTLLGETAEPGYVTGVGPITSTEALLLAGISGGSSRCSCGSNPSDPHDVVFRRLLTDPGTGYLLDVAEHQYRPSHCLDRAVRSRDGVCRFPGCSRPAATKRSGTDLDHTIPWPRGQTAASNLAVLCRHHHLLKHSPGWDAELLPDGVMEWTSPSGKVLRSEPWVYADPG